MPSDLSYRVSDRRLARVDESWYAQRQPWEPEEWTRVVVDDGTGPFYSSSGDRVAAPGSRTAYYSPGVAWQQHASSGGFRTRPETWFDRVRTYRAGDRRETEWFKLPTLTAMAANRDGSPARIAERQGSLVGFAFPTWQDSVEGRYAAGGFRDIGGLTPLAGRRVRRSQPVPVRPGRRSARAPTSSRLEVTQVRTSRHDFWELGRGTVSRFTFRTSRPKGETTAALPIALPRYDAPVDERNLAPAGPGFPVSVTFHGQDGYDPGRLRSFTAKVTFDQVVLRGRARPSRTTPGPRSRSSAGATAGWPSSTTPPAAGRTASLWITAEDSHGTRTEQFTASLYGVQ